jgi:glucose/arabinose dehydrogenase
VRRVRRLGARLLTAVLVAATLGVVAPVTHIVTPETASAAGVFTDGYFREVDVLGGITRPTTVRFAADGRAFVGQKDGVVKAFDSIADTTPTTVIDLRTVVDDYWDRGLLGLALDPHFLSPAPNARPYLYLYYVYDAPPGGTAPVWNDTCRSNTAVPPGPGSTFDGCVVTGRLDRYTVNLATNVADPASRVELGSDWCAQYPSHDGGGMVFGADGQLYLAAGDGASFNFTDYGQGGGRSPDPTSPITPINPCGDPVTVTSPPGVTPVVDLPTAEGGSLRSQDVRTTGDPVGLDGSLIRISPDTGAASAGNPLAASADLNARKIVAHGFRNPYRMTVRPGTDEIYVGDVGNAKWEEIERVVLPPGPATPTTLPNFGWPCYEGDSVADGWSTLGSNMCDALYAQGAGAITQPVYTYSHSGTTAPCGTSGATSASVTGLAFYDASAADGVAYPAKYDGALFFVDYSRNCLAALLPGAGGVPDKTKMEVVATGIGNPVDLVAGPHGDLYYADLLGNRIVRIRYLVAPVAKGKVTPAVAAPPVSVTLDASGSTDPDPEAVLTDWDWDLDHDGVFGGPADKSGKVVTWDIATKGVYPITLRVTSSNGLTDTAELSVDASDAPPDTVTISSPDAGVTWSVGDVIDFAGSAHDPEDGAMPSSALTWTLVMHHCTGTDCHEHTIETFPGVASGSFAAPDHEYPSYLELRLTATDIHGASTTASVDLQPVTAVLSVGSVPAGVPIPVGGESQTSPSATTVIRNGTVTLSPPATWAPGGTLYTFAHWNDGAPRVRDVVVPGDMSLTATYSADAANTCAGASAIGLSKWVTNYAGGNGDVDWYSFTVPSTKRVVITLGDLPVDARLDLYHGCSTRLTGVDHVGTRFEELTRVLTAGTYRVRVSVPSDTAGATPYALRVMAVGSTVAIKSKTVRTSSGTTRIIGEVLNNTRGTIGRVTIKATFKDSGGHVVRTLTGLSFATRIGVGGLSPFVISGSTPAYTSVTCSLKWVSPTSSRTLTLRTLTTTANPDGTVTESGTVKNTGTTTANYVVAARTWYGRRGEVLDAGWASTVPSKLARGATGRFRITRPVLENVESSRTLFRGK